ncbi:MAG: hypothetical protein Q7U38_17415 [Methylobacter sp.]|nr:hypothetical protein [Methylobacter sp.]MDP2099834.1 hypothetical protein [Methylobacter sp.]MDP2427954.1 hypothetical protein [Methylobacter sp.]MDP3054214.1 hypothetical protein [Methylobacter sp.]MDP3361129.1 hypothetical protein [Methylobacter sp.]
MTLRKLIEQRIAAETTCFKEIAGAASMEAVMLGAIETPGCYVFRERNSANPGSTMPTRQQKTDVIAVVIASRNVRGGKGVDSSDDNEALCQAVEVALLGWEPNGVYSPLEYAGGALVSFKNGLFIWRDAYRATSQIRGA